MNCPRLLIHARRQGVLVRCAELLSAVRVLAHAGGLAGFLISFGLTTESPAQILHAGDFESGDLSAFELQAAHEDSLGVVSHPVRSGKWAGKSLLRSTDPKVSKGTRAEFVDKTPSPLHQDHWYALSIFAGEEFVCPIERDGIVFQFHQHAKTGSPVLAFRLINHTWKITSNTDLAGPRRTFVTSPFETGQWTDWVIKVKWSGTATGELTIWKNDQVIFQESNLKTTYAPEQAGPYPKFGQYHTVDETPENTLYFDSYVMAGPRSHYADVAPSHRALD